MHDDRISCPTLYHTYTVKATQTPTHCRTFAHTHIALFCVQLPKQTNYKHNL